MPKDPLLPDPPREGDSWESLAGNLFGIDLNSGGESSELSLEELESLDVAPPEPPPVETPADPGTESVEATATAVADTKPEPEPDTSQFDTSESDDAPAGFDEPVGFDEPPPVAAEAKPATSDAPADDAEDEFWDPLKSWAWDDDDVVANAEEETADDDTEVVEPEIVKGPGTDARRAAETFDTVSDYRTEYENEEKDDWDFGAGLLEDVPPPEKTEKQPRRREPVEKPEERKPAREPAAKEERPARKPEREERPAKPAAKPAAVADDFGAGLIESAAPADSSAEERRDVKSRETESSDADKPRERRSRRGRRRRSSSSDRGAESRERETESKDRGAESKAAREESVPDEESRDDDWDATHEEQREPDDGGERKKSDKKSPYRNIPTWETAISYLLNTGATGASRGESGADGKSSGERRPRRRRRRRPRS